jgi:hypothetical protein
VLAYPDGCVAVDARMVLTSRDAAEKRHSERTSAYIEPTAHGLSHNKTDFFAIPCFFAIPLTYRSAFFIITATISESLTHQRDNVSGKIRIIP